MSQHKLKPCPFCGSDDTRVHEWLFGAVIHCSSCGSKGPIASAMETAVKFWNKRARIKRDRMRSRTP
ncbi:MAG: Lar family restriction alleviation protein [Gammaproteobacteria bacterium]|nr:Lar family restriction alleviation protein [Gammaproteobacteria bacterium]